MEKDGYYYYCLGVDSLKNGKKKDAIEFFLESLSKEDHFKTHHELSILYKERDLYDEAGYHLEKAYSLNPNNDKVATDYSKMLITRNKIDDAKMVIRTILKRNKSYGPAIRLQKELLKKLTKQ